MSSSASEPWGVYLLATTDAGNVLFRRVTGLPYDTIAAQFNGTVYALECATRAPPAATAIPSPQPAPAFRAFLAAGATTIRDVRFVAVPEGDEERAAFVRFVAATFLSTVPPWTRWSAALLEPFCAAAGPSVPVPVARAPWTVWEKLGGTLSPGGTDGSPLLLSPAAPSGLGPEAAAVQALVATWLAQAQRGAALVDVNELLAAVGLPPVAPDRAAEAASAALLVVHPPDRPRGLYPPGGATVVPLWQPCLDAYSHHEIEQLNVVLHTEEYLPQPAFDMLREACRKKLETHPKR